MPKSHSTRGKELGLTERDEKIVHYVTKHRVVALDQLEPLFFAVAPNTRTKNTNPARACERRTLLLASYGYLLIDTAVIAGRRRRVVVPGTLAHLLTGVSPSRRRVAPQKTGHAIRTLDAVRVIERLVHLMGGRILNVEHEADLRVDAQNGRFLRAGDELPALPDAVVTYSVRSDGEERKKRVAVEYVTSKYSDADITKKRDGFEGYTSVIWFADNQTTAKRVERLTRASCQVLS